MVFRKDVEHGTRKAFTGPRVTLCCPVFLVEMLGGVQVSIIGQVNSKVLNAALAY